MAAVSFTRAEGAGAPSRPNIIFLLADDLRWDALGCYGNGVVRTPHIDRLAARGVRFRNHFVTTSICNVSRASILTGQYARRHGITDFSTSLGTGRWRETYPALLRSAGYRTGFIGKYGVGDDRSIAAMEKEFDYWRGLPGQAGLFFAANDPTRTHKTARFGEQALEFLRSCESNQPFCLSVSFNAPHARDGQPREFAPDHRDEGLYLDSEIPAPDKAGEEWFQTLPEFVKSSEGRRRWGRRFTNEIAFQRTAKDYYRLITGLDREVGRIITLLEDRHLATNTVVVFSSDNGFFLGERGLADKWLMYEESIRVPLIICDPRLPSSRRGATVQALTLNIDLAPTFLDFAGQRAPGVMQGQSLVPLLHGKSPRDWREEFFYEHYTRRDIIPPSEGVRTTRWKYLRWMNVAPPVEELYDLASDPGEKHNLSSDPAHAEQLVRSRKRWAKLRDQLR